MSSARYKPQINEADDIDNSYSLRETGYKSPFRGNTRSGHIYHTKPIPLENISTINRHLKQKRCWDTLFKCTTIKIALAALLFSVVCVAITSKFLITKQLFSIINVIC